MTSVLGEGDYCVNRGTVTRREYRDVPESRVPPSIFYCRCFWKKSFLIAGRGTDVGEGTEKGKESFF